LVAPAYRTGYLKKGSTELFSEKNKNFMTTEWFRLDEGERFLVMSGDAYNRAVWQFALQDGTVVTDVPTEKKYRTKTGKKSGLTFPKAEIPRGAVRARVFFARRDDEETLPLGDRLQIEYGLVPTFFEPYREQHFPVEGLKKGKQLLYFEGRWYITGKKGRDMAAADGAEPGAGRKSLRPGLFSSGLVEPKGMLAVDSRVWFTDGNGRELELSYFGEPAEALTGQMLSAGKTAEQLPGCAAGTPENSAGGRNFLKTTGRYGVRIRRRDSVPVCERIGDAEGLHFNYMLGDEPAAPYENDFDRIYPWGAMRRCAVSFPEGKRRIVYEGEEGYAADGSAGEVMVEIPKHYVRRRVEGDTEEIWISACPGEGCETDPSFCTPEGELDAIYIGAYFAAEESGGEGGRLVSRAGRQVSMYRSAAEFCRMAKANAGFQELDLCAMLTVQRLFLVESAVLDSQSIFEGNTYMPYMISDKMSTYYSLDTAERTNSIRLKDNSISRRYLEGDAVAVMNVWSDFYSPEYANTGRVVTGRTQRDDGSVEITFSGSPVRLTAHGTGMSALPEHTGSCDGLSGATGTKAAGLPERAHDAFRYRGIENPWGGIWVVLDGCNVTGRRLEVSYPDGRTEQIAYLLPEQSVSLTSKTFGDPENMYVKTMGYDEKNPLIALPAEIGQGAGNCSWYCDAWFCSAEAGKRYVVTFGGAWDNMGYAGLFSFRASFTQDQKITFNGARLMCRERSAG
ncbi:MAG: hypothetical protein K2N94_13555, partial [Lachnospiraceae bacterium]|nr:hypothetical protein [Lachnospiraceae bacterium]